MNGKYEKKIDQYIPDGITLTEVQQGYLTAVVELIEKQKTVKMVDVAHHLNKSTGAVSSAMKLLNSKGILETNSSGEIMLCSPSKKITVSKTSASKVPAKSTATKLSKFNEKISFDLPKGFEMIWNEKDDGTKDCQIVTGKYKNDDGNDAYKFIASVSEMEIQDPDGKAIKGEKPLEKLHRGDPERKYVTISDDPAAEYQVKATPIAFLSTQIKLYVKVLCIETSAKKALMVFQTATWDEEHPEEHLAQFKQLDQVTKAIRVNGNPLKLKRITIESISKKLVPEYDDAASIGKIGLNIKVNDKLVYTDDEKQQADLDDLEEKCRQLNCSFWAGQLSDCEDKFIEEIDIPYGVTEIGTSAFEGCSMLRRVTIPDTVTRIEISAFEDCSALEEIEIPDSVTEMQGCVFQNCTSLRKAKLPSGITTIAFSMFNGCSELADVEIPDGVTTIENQVFNACSSLTEIVLPDSIELIDRWAFDECDNLEAIYMPDKEVEIGAWAIPDNATVIKRPLGKTKASGRSKASGNKSSKASSPKGRFSVVTPGDEYYSHYGKLKREHEKFTGMGVQHVSNNGKEHEAIPLVGLMERQGKTDNPVYKKLKQIEAKDKYSLKDTALLMAQVFRVEKSKFDARHDDEGDIGVTMLEKKWQFSALRSFAWTLADLADREGKSIDDYDINDLIELCRFIEQRKWLNYDGGSWFGGLCGHDDIHVFYMPQTMIDDGSAEGIYDVFKYGPIVSLDAFRADLALLKNSMIKIHNKLLENRDRSMRLDSPEASVLKTWCALVMSAETAFFSEDGPMVFFHSYPETPLNNKPIPLASKAAKQKKAAPKAKKEDPAESASGADMHVLTIGPDGIRRVRVGEYPAGEPIVWRILDDSDGETYLMISEYALDAMPFCGGFGNTTNEWAGSTLRSWLNDEFLNSAFTNAEKNKIITVTHTNQKKTQNGFEQVEPTSEKVSLLDSTELQQYFPNERDRLCKATSYAKSHGAEISGGPDLCNWWLRSPAVEAMGLPMWSPRVQTDGSTNGWGYSSGEICVRPVIRVKKDFIQTELIKNANDEARKKTQQAKKTGKYTLDMLPEGQEDAEAILAELNEMDPEQAENTLSALIAVHKLQKELADLSAMIGGDEQEDNTAQREAEERRRRDEEVQRQRERASLEREIASLEQERDGLRGLFAGFKRSKLQRQIDELKGRLRRL